MPEHGDKLTTREVELLRLVATGATNRQIAHTLHISVNTVKVHVRNILTKLDASSRTEATMIAVREGLVVVAGRAEPSPDETSGGETPVGQAPPDEYAQADRPLATGAETPPSLPWPKRVALVVVPLVVAAVTVMATRGAAAPPLAERGDLPPESPQEQEVSTEPESGDSRWHRRAQMPTPRAYLALASVAGQLIAIGGRTPEGVTSAVEVYDPHADIWSRGSDKPTPVGYVAAAAIGSDVYVPGGCDADFRPLRTLEIYDSDSDSWRTASPLPAPRCAYAVAALEDKLLLIGGWDGAGYVATVFAYDPAEDAWSDAEMLNEPRGFAAAAALEGDVYVVGGYDGRRELTNCARLGPQSDSWQPCAPLTVGRGGLGLAALGQQLFAIGGGGWQSYLGFNERYDPAADTWNPIETPLTGEWRSPGVGVLDYTLYAVGGWDSGYLSLNQAYDVLRYRIFIPVSEAQ